jgi:hypothetical protein
MEERSTRAVAALTGVNFTVIGDVLRGDVWVHLATIARLEHGQNCSFFNRHRHLQDRMSPCRQ